MRGRSVEQNALVSLLVVLAIAGGMTWLVSSATADSIRYSSQVYKLTDAMEAVAVLKEHLIDLETGERGYIISGSEIFLQPHISALTELGEYREIAAEKLKLAGVGQTDIDVLMQHVVAKIAISRANVQARRQGFEAARSLVGRGEGRREMDDIRTNIDGVNSGLSMRRDDLRKLRDQAMETLKRNIALAALMMVAVAVVLHVRLLRLMRFRYEAEQKIQHLASHDALTGLPNRRMMMDHLELALRRSKRSTRQMALLLLDLNGFKPVNDEHGHEAGDKVLKQVAHRLTKVVRASDLVARLGGDEFVIVVENIADRDGVCGIVGKLDTEISSPIRLQDGVEVQVTTSIGVALYPLDGGDVETLLRVADTAMYEAKHGGSNCYCKEQRQLRQCVLAHDGA